MISFDSASPAPQTKTHKDVKLRGLFSNQSATLRIVGIYASVGFLWIYCSDTVLGWLVQDPLIITRIAIFKGTFFIAMTSLLLFLLIGRYSRNITTSERAQRVSEQLYRRLVENIPLGIALMDQHFRVVKVNSTLAQWFAHPPEWFVGQYCFEAFEKRGEICPHCPGQVSMASGELCSVETEGIRKGVCSLLRIPVCLNLR